MDTVEATHGSIEADLTGASISGQVAIGEHIVQIQAGPGARVTYVPSDKRPVVRLRRLPVSRLPRDFPGLLGREAELRVVRRSLRDGVPVEVCGQPGSGKTVLLRHVAHRSEGVAGDGEVFLSCGHQPVEDVLQFIFECCYESDVVFAPTRAQLCEHLQDRRLLVLLDDVELSRGALEEVMDTAPRALFLSAAPSRLLWGEGETLALGGLELQAALALWERGLGRPLRPGERAGAEATCRALDGSPLRILQAAALARDDEGDSDAVRRAGAGLLSSLSDDERAVLGPLAAVPGAPVSATRVAAVTGVPDAGAVLSSLSEHGLVEAQGAGYRLLHEGDPAFLEPPRAEWRKRLAASFAQAPKAWAAEFPDNAEAALSLLSDGARDRRWGEVLSVARATDAAASLAGRTGTWGIAVDHALEAARALGDHAAEGWALHQQGSRALCLGDRDLAASALGEALAIRERLGDTRGAATTRHNLEQLAGPPPPPSDDPPPSPPAPRPRAPKLVAAIAVVALGMIFAVLLSGRGDPAPAGNVATTSEPSAVTAPAKTVTETRTSTVKKSTARTREGNGRGDAGGGAATDPRTGGGTDPGRGKNGQRGSGGRGGSGSDARGGAKSDGGGGGGTGDDTGGIGGGSGTGDDTGGNGGGGSSGGTSGDTGGGSSSGGTSGDTGGGSTSGGTVPGGLGTADGATGTGGAGQGSGGAYSAYP